MNDDRWGGYVPWFLRYSELAGIANFPTFFQHVGQRLRRLIRYNETGAVMNSLHFGECLETESLQRFKFRTDKPLDTQIEKYFSPDAMTKDTYSRLNNDAEEKIVLSLQMRQTLAMFERRDWLKGGTKDSPTQKEDTSILEQQLKKARKKAEDTKNKRFQVHFRAVVIERLTTLESLLQLLPPESEEYSKLIRDLRRFMVESRITLDIKGIPPLLVPLDEPLLQREVIDNVLTRLHTEYPQRANEFFNMYHDLVAGKNLDSIFSEAFKTLEEIARSVSGEKSFVFDREHLRKNFPKLHKTIHETVIRLAAHRGDEASHGRSAPDTHEIRYLLFSIFNVALLLLDYPRNETA